MLKQLTGISFAALLSLSAAILGNSGAHAAPNVGQEPGGHLVITEVLVDFTLGEEAIFISVENFDISNPDDLVVALGKLGMITDKCGFMPDPDLVINCDFSVDGLPLNGDYLLTVATSGGQSEVATYDLTIGAVGPVGPEGPEGPAGPQGPLGPRGAPGLIQILTFSATSTLDFAESQTINVPCAEGEVIYGHYDFSYDPNMSPPSVSLSGPYFIVVSVASSGWRVVTNPNSGIHTLTVVAVCANRII